jgi:hypothetical protein
VEVEILICVIFLYINKLAKSVDPHDNALVSENPLTSRDEGQAFSSSVGPIKVPAKVEVCISICMDQNKLAISGDARDPGLFLNTLRTLRDEFYALGGSVGPSK